MIENDSILEEGFYWIKIDPHPAEIAKWDGYANWWTAGADHPVETGTVQLLSDRLVPPST